jgi:hypothetical protein
MGGLAIIDHSLREQFQGGDQSARHARTLLEAYYPLVRSVFPIEGELETVAAYDEYLRDPTMEWDIIVLTEASSGRIIGGIQWQALRDVRTSWVNGLAWVEHIWLANEPGVRSYGSFRHLLVTVRKHMRKRAVDIGFMEFNDPEKMTTEEMEQDAAGGLSSWDRLLLWARVGLSELAYLAPDGRYLPVPYAQPSMEGGPPVRMLSLGFFSLAQDLGDVHLRADEYLQILYRAHSTIRDVDPATDPTCLEYTAALRALGVSELCFVPLQRRLSGRRPRHGGGHAGEKP